jgi:hypothetical protein
VSVGIGPSSANTSATNGWRATMRASKVRARAARSWSGDASFRRCARPRGPPRHDRPRARAFRRGRPPRPPSPAGSS